VPFRIPVGVIVAINTAFYDLAPDKKFMTPLHRVELRAGKLLARLHVDFIFLNSLHVFNL
jgi:hypothetical protein